MSSGITNTETKKRRGRPPGSRNKPKVNPKSADIPTRKDLNEHLLREGIKPLPVPEKVDRRLSKFKPLPLPTEKLAGLVETTHSHNRLEKTLSVSDIQRIIEASSRHNVSSINCLGLSISFHRPKTVGKKAVEVLNQVSDTELSDTKLDPVREPKDVRMQLTQEDLELHREAELATLMTEDPAAYEAHVIDAQLNPRIGHDQIPRGSESDLQ